MECPARCGSYASHAPIPCCDLLTGLSSNQASSLHLIIVLLQAFGVGALEEDDDDIFSQDTIAAYNAVIDLPSDMERSLTYGWTGQTGAEGNDVVIVLNIIIVIMFLFVCFLGTWSLSNFVKNSTIPCYSKVMRTLVLSLSLNTSYD